VHADDVKLLSDTEIANNKVQREIIKGIYWSRNKYIKIAEN
jgi:hypothetical protein